MKHETQPTSPRRQVLVAAAPDDSQAVELVKALRLLGLSATIAQTVGVASLADEAAVCIIVLRPEKWRTTPSITTAMRCNPRYMIPVLAESMPLPPGSWATEPINIKESLTETAHELVTLITSYIQTLPKPVSAFAEQRVTIRSLTGSSASIGRRASSSTSRVWKRISILLLVLVVLLVASLLIRYVPHSSTLTRIPFTTRSTITQNNFLNHSYTAAVPGPGCDFGGAVWEIGGYYKAPVTPTAMITKTPVQASPTLQVINDNSTLTTCQQNGLLVKHTNHFDAYATIIFESTGQALPHHFSIQIIASVVAASDTASFGLGVRDQNAAPTSRSYDRGYGNDYIDVGVDGSWSTERYNDTTDQMDARFTKGFVKPAKIFSLGAEVDGSSMTFTINKQNVTTVVDTTFPNSYGIAFGISDPDAKSPPSALFSHFVYMPLADTPLTTSAVVATATALAAKQDQTPYTAPMPGFGCDKGAGQWKPTLEAEDYVTTRCLQNGLLVTQQPSERYVGGVFFYWLDGNFPANYKVKVRIDVSGLNGGCVGLKTRTDAWTVAGYSFFVCTDGSWQIESYDSFGHIHELSQGQIAQHSSYSMEVMSNGPTQSLMLDDTQVSSVSDESYTTTDHIKLTISCQGSSGSAIFSNFVFTPLA